MNMKRIALPCFTSLWIKDRDKIKDCVNIDSQSFQLTLQVERFDNDTQGLLHVNIISDMVSAKAEMDVSLKDYEKFVESIQELIEQ